eukprot:TRINITY_DN10935_c0_g1_i1.p1 TRINITY_DN10935_c0_g1~~TRINITY_DN10935_c0_g1_i1.p1  ORF type:complete len:257 (-),score=32.37 TRINITY_DN10935_c0_g1_i1:60-830(-)
MFNPFATRMARTLASRASPRVALQLPRRAVHTSNWAAAGTGGLSVHRDTPKNKESTPFEFNEESMVEVRKHIAKYPPQYKQSATIPLLDIAQRQYGGWLPLSAMHKVAKILDIPEMEVYETASFYTMFNRNPVGKHLIQLCTTTPCELCGSGEIVDACKKHLGINLGETTADGMFTLIEVECLGACVNAPMMQIGDDYFEDLTATTVVDVLEKMKRGEPPKVGPQRSDRSVCEPVGEKTSLKEEPSGQFCRDLSKC